MAWQRGSCAPAGAWTFSNGIRWLTPPANFDAALRASAQIAIFTAQLNQLPKPDFIRKWCAVAYAFSGLHPDGYEEADSRWPRVLRRFADEKLYPCDAQWSGLYDRMHTHEDDETARRFQIAADYGAPADG